MGKAKRFNAYDNSVAESRKQVEVFGQSRQNYAGLTSGFGMTTKGKTFNNKQSNILSLQNGGELRGPIGFTGEVHAIDATNQLDLAKNSSGVVKQIRGLIFVSSATATTLDEIIGKKYDGQMVILTGINTQSAITITHASGVAGQILCPGDINYTLSDDESVILIDDVTASTQSWRLISNSLISGVTESQATVTWTGIHSFSGTTTSLNSSSILLGDSVSDSISLGGRIVTDIKIDSGNVIKSYDTQEIGYQVTNGTQTVGLKGSLESPVYGTVTVSKSTLDTQFGNLSGNFGFIDTGSGNITLYFRQADGNWAGASLTRDTAT
jgi:hypothetical protein